MNPITALIFCILAFAMGWLVALWFDGFSLSAGRSITTGGSVSSSEARRRRAFANPSKSVGPVSASARVCDQHSGKTLESGGVEMRTRTQEVEHGSKTVPKLSGGYRQASERLGKIVGLPLTQWNDTIGRTRKQVVEACIKAKV